MGGRQGRIVVAMVCVTFAGAALAAGASAAPEVLNLDEGVGHGSIAPGSSVSVATGGPVSFESSKGTIECPDASSRTSFAGQLTTNRATKDEFSLESGTFMGGEECSSSVVLNAQAEVVPLDLPWKVAVTKPGIVKITGSPEVVIDIHFAGHHGYHCLYEKAMLRGSVEPAPVSGTEQQLTIAITHRSLRRNEIYDSPLCPGAVNMTADFTEVSGTTEVIYDSII